MSNLTTPHPTQMTELRIVYGENSKIHLHTYDPEYQTYLYFNFGFIPNLGRVLSQDEIQHVQKTLSELGVNSVKIDSTGFSQFDGDFNSNSALCVRDVLCFGDIFGVYGIVVFWDETLQKWLTEPVSVSSLMHVHQKMNKALNQQFNPMKSSFT